jgi:hypothetical protein
MSCFCADKITANLSTDKPIHKHREQAGQTASLIKK